MVRSQVSSNLTIATLARTAAVSVETVRYYQRRGLMPEPERSGGAAGPGIRRYDAADVRKLKFIRSAQAAGFSLAEIGQLMALDATEDRSRAREMARARVAALERRIAELEAARKALARLADQCSAETTGPCPILKAFDHPD